jgi:hypothetical protein
MLDRPRQRFRNDRPIRAYSDTCSFHGFAYAFLSSRPRNPQEKRAGHGEIGRVGLR